jgi:hypothetical protein
MLEPFTRMLEILDQIAQAFLGVGEVRFIWTLKLERASVSACV